MLEIVEGAEPAGDQRLDRLRILVQGRRTDRHQVHDLARDPGAVEEQRGTAAQQLGAHRVEGDHRVHEALLVGRHVLLRLLVDDLDIALPHPVLRQGAAQHIRSQDPALDRHPLAHQVLHGAQLRPPDDGIAAVGDVDHQYDPRSKIILGQHQHLVQADRHAVDGLVAESPHDLAGRGILDEPDRLGIEKTEIAREIEGLAAGPDVGADAQRRRGIVAASGEGQQDQRESPRNAIPHPQPSPPPGRNT